MKSYQYFIAAAGLALSTTLASCKKELARINTNPNAVENPQPAYLLTSAIKNACDNYWNIGAADGSGNPTNLFVQYWAADQYTDQDRYIFTNTSFQGFWSGFYSGSIVDLDEIISLAKQENNSNYAGIALTLRSWEFCLLTDAFGDIPYSQSIQIQSTSTPSYDPQQKVYEGILNDLQEAQDSLNSSGAAVSGDILYNGNINAWKAFNNSLQLRIALRISDREPDKAKEVIQNIENAGGNYISSNSETAQLNYLSAAPNDNPLAELFLTRDDYRISRTIVDTLFALNDPRLPIYAAPTQNPTSQTYVGMPNGLLPGDAGVIGLANTSRPGAVFLAPTAPAVIMSYAEVLFDRAEAAARGFTNEDPVTLYNEAITASLQQYGIDQVSINKYLAQPAVQYNPANFRESIGIQKWIALFGEGPEAFAEWRRLGYPQLKPAVAGVLNGQMPLRFIYPGTEQSLNGKSYQQAVADQGPDLLTTRLWFDIN